MISRRRSIPTTALVVATTLLAACLPLSPAQLPTPIPVGTLVAQTAAAAATQTEAARPTDTPLPPPTETPTRTPPPPTETLTPTPTFVFLLPTLTYTPTNTFTPSPPTEWPDWKTGTVVKVKTGGGTNKMFDVLVNAKVVVVRPNGVKLRSMPTKVVGGPKAPKGTILVLTGLWNKNYQFNWSFVQVTAPDGGTYWVGGTEGDDDTDPQAALVFYQGD